MVDQDVQRRAGDPLLGADDMGDGHEVVVDDVRQVIGRKPIGLQQHGIVQIGVLEDDRAAQLILDDRLPL